MLPIESYSDMHYIDAGAETQLGNTDFVIVNIVILLAFQNKLISGSKKTVCDYRPCQYTHILQ